MYLYQQHDKNGLYGIAEGIFKLGLKTGELINNYHIQKPADQLP
jgi:hypothetical protein